MSKNDRYNARIKRAAKRLSHLTPEHIVCRYCGEASASGSFKGFCHKWGPTKHRFYPIDAVLADMFAGRSK